MLTNAVRFPDSLVQRSRLGVGNVAVRVLLMQRTELIPRVFDRGVGALKLSLFIVLTLRLVDERVLPRDLITTFRVELILPRVVASRLGLALDVLIGLSAHLEPALQACRCCAPCS